MALGLLFAACGKSERTAAQHDLKSTATPTPTPTMEAKIRNILNLKQTEREPEDVFSLSRNGEKVTIRLEVDFADCRGLRILRNDADMALNRQIVARLPANTVEYVDTVPEARAYWYWIEVDMDNNSTKRIGPIRVRADTAKAGKYIDASAGMELIALRTQSSVVIAWDLPKEKYNDVVISRRHKPDFMRGQRTKVYTTKVARGDFTDQLPDTDVDYWYWIDATKEDGSVISKGPVKAGYKRGD